MFILELTILFCEYYIIGVCYCADKIKQICFCVFFARKVFIFLFYFLQRLIANGMQSMMSVAIKDVLVLSLAAISPAKP